MTNTALDRLARELSLLLKRIYDYCTMHVEKGPTIGACIANPKYVSVPTPTKNIQAELERRATEHFKNLSADAYYFQYWTPPVLPVSKDSGAERQITADDYQLSFDLPVFDEKWQQTISSRSLIYCPLDNEQNGWSDWFELQLEAIRLTPLLYQTLKECKIKAEFELKLAQPGTPSFISFIYDYALDDPHFSMTKKEQEEWLTKKVNWKTRYKLAAEVIKSATTLAHLYAIARDKAASTRNPMLKALFRSFIEHIENNLVIDTELPEEEKKRLLLQLRKTKTRPPKNKYQAKRPAVCISDIECAHVLYVLITDFLTAKQRNGRIAEGILFIWIAQHAAFSGLQLTVDELLSIRVTDINFIDLTIEVKGQTMDLTGGLNQILIAYIGDGERKEGEKRENKRRLFQFLSYDLLEDILGRASSKFYGQAGKLLPRDFLEKVHVTPGARIPLDLRRQITRQEELVKQSPYRIDPRIIKKHIKESIDQKSLKR